jgi:RNA polymerase sigma-70 factor (ECF subfamily)
VDSTQGKAALELGKALAAGLDSADGELGQPLATELYTLAEAALCGLSLAEFCAVLAGVGARSHWGQPPGSPAGPALQQAFYRALRLADLALAQGCALGREAAWQRFLTLYRAPVLQAAIALGGSATAGHELADALTADLFGLRERDGQRTSPLSSYSGRGSLLGWLRTTLAQRHVDRHRRTRRETPLDELEVAAQPATESPVPAELTQLTAAVSLTLGKLPPEDRYLLAAYFLDRQTLTALGRILKVHEATVSRRLKRLAEEVHQQLLINLQAAGLSPRAAQERLGTDPRDLEINLREALQTSQLAAFPVQHAKQGPRA